MKQRPIIFSALMVQAILAGRKTQTRRALKIQPSENWKPESYGEVHKMINGHPDSDKVMGHGYCNYEGDEAYACKFGKVGDQLWVRETFAIYGDVNKCVIHYRANYPNHVGRSGMGYKPSIHMPRWASRILLEITDIRVERLQDISEADAVAEGSSKSHPSIDKVSQTFGFADWPRSWFAQTWDHINGTGSWEANPWVWVVEFKVVEPQGGDL